MQGIIFQVRIAVGDSYHLPRGKGDALLGCQVVERKVQAKSKNQLAIPTRTERWAARKVGVPWWSVHDKMP